MGRPWGNALDRLLAERRGLKKQDLAKMANVRPGTISALYHPDKMPTTQTIAALCEALTAWDRRGNPLAPDVQMWEFFVSDEQAAALRDIERAKADALRKSEPASVAESIAQMQQALVSLQQQLVDIEQKRRAG